MREYLNAVCRRLAGLGRSLASTTRIGTKLAATLVLTGVAMTSVPAAFAQEDHLPEEAASLINNIRQRLNSCGDDGGTLGEPSLQRVGMSASTQRPYLIWNDRLAVVAAAHGRAMVKENFFDHVDMKGRTIGQRATDGGYRWKVVGENLAAGQKNLGDAMRGWLLSATHCHNLIDARFTEFGIAKVRNPSPSDPYGTYWVLVMGKPQAPVQQFVQTAVH